MGARWLHYMTKLNDVKITSRCTLFCILHPLFRRLINEEENTRPEEKIKATTSTVNKFKIHVNVQNFHSGGYSGGDDD